MSEPRASLTVSLGQFNVHPGEPEDNLRVVREWVAEAARRGSDLVVFPELWDTGYALSRAQELGTPVSTGRFAQVAQLAVQHQIHIVGSMLELGTRTGAEGLAYNTAVWYAPDGAVSGSYRKIHLFRYSPLEEDRYLTPGGIPQCVTLPWGIAGMAICYDLRFPELFRHYAVAGAVMTVIPAQWPHARIDHWRTLLRARAIENQMIVIGCNRVGTSEGQAYGGSSAIYDARGNLLVEGNDQESLLTTQVDIGEALLLRREFPTLSDRRPELYDLFGKRDGHCK